MVRIWVDSELGVCELLGECGTHDRSAHGQPARHPRGLVRRAEERVLTGLELDSELCALIGDELRAGNALAVLLDDEVVRRGLGVVEAERHLARLGR